MKKLFYIVMIMLIGSPVFAAGSPVTKKHKMVKLASPHKNKVLTEKYKSIEKHPVPKMSIKNPKAIYDN